MTDAVIRARALVSGRVQGVFYRASCAEDATRLGVAGWVQNLPDGRVEAAFEGPSERVGAMLDWCRHGPRAASVTHVEVHDEPLAGEKEFSVR